MDGDVVLCSAVAQCIRYGTLRKLVWAPDLLYVTRDHETAGSVCTALPPWSQPCVLYAVCTVRYHNNVGEIMGTRSECSRLAA